MRTRVKICGVTRSEDAQVAVEAGADALGMVFHGASPRNISLDQARQIAADIPGFVTLVGLFVDMDASRVAEILSRVPIQLLQFHGDEEPGYCEQFGLPYIKALRVGGSDTGGLHGDSLRNKIDSYSTARGILLDTYQKGVPGGTGAKFDWDLVPDVESKIILAGGLNPGNVSDAIVATRPYAVDVSGGVESAPGTKDADRIRAFLKAVQQADMA